MKKVKNDVGNQSGDTGTEFGDETLGIIREFADREGLGVTTSGNFAVGDTSFGSGDESGSRGDDSGVGATNGVGNDGLGGFATVGSLGTENADNGSSERRRGRGRPRRDSGDGGRSESGRTGNESGRSTSTETEKLDSENTSRIKEPKKGFGSFFSDTDEPKKSAKKSSAIFEKTETVELIAWLFLMLATFLGDHWKLKRDEANQLGEKLHAVLEQFPVTVAKKYSKELEKYAPFVSLAFTGAIIIVPRVKETINQNESNESKSIRGRSEAGNVQPITPSATANPNDTELRESSPISTPFSTSGYPSVFKQASINPNA